MSIASAARPLKKSAVGSPSSADQLSIWVPASTMTLEAFRAWATSLDFPSHVRAAFIKGEIFIDMSNEDPRTHVVVKSELVSVLRPFCQEQDKGELLGDGVLISNEAARLSNNPDASFYYWKTLESGRIRYVPRETREGAFRELEGTPDWVAEVVSDTSEEKDTERLRAAYHRAGVMEYWIIDVRGEEVVFHILYHRKKGYVEAPVVDGWQKSRVFKREFRLVRRRTRMNLWDFRLQMRE